ncbi:MULTISPECIES: hypothetical protein [Bradyrhizobium]|uniref:hypothetical protein n=1 Tax=Bradyrhizobium TaxID=374 RepID=UPI00211DE061|nr:MULTISPECIES: hypothetical protein [Bradyrhizobium]
MKKAKKRAWVARSGILHQGMRDDDIKGPGVQRFVNRVRRRLDQMLPVASGETNRAALC